MSDTSIKIPAELFALAESSHFEGTIDIPVLEVGPDDYRFSEPLPWEVTVTNTGAALLVAGTVTGHGVTACSRCLEDVEHDFNGAIEGYFLMNGASEDYDDEFAEGDLDDEEFDTLPDDHIIDMEPLIVSALFVDAVPMPLCKPDCAGLCSVCGANLNEGDCGCGSDPDLEDFAREANPFSVLANLKFD